jgi:hypothetical protein
MNLDILFHNLSFLGSLLIYRKGLRATIKKKEFILRDETLK